MERRWVEHVMAGDVGDVDWMTLADPYILDYLNSCSCYRGTHAKQTPKSISLNTPLQRSQVSNRCSALTEHGLVEKIDRGVYRITDTGQRFIEGDLSTDELQGL